MRVLYEKRHTSTAHSYFQPHWSKKKNQDTYGSKYSENGMGHNLSIVAGFDLKSLSEQNLKKLVSHFEDLVKSIDHKDLNKDLEFFKSHPPTVESLGLYFFQQFFQDGRAQLGPGFLSVEVQEGPDLRCRISTKNLTENQTENPTDNLTDCPSVDLIKKITVQFVAGNESCQGNEKSKKSKKGFSPKSQGSVKGYDLDVEVTLKGEINSETGMLIPHDELDRILNLVVVRPFQGQLLTASSQRPELFLVDWTNKLAMRLGESLVEAGFLKLTVLGLRVSCSPEFFVSLKFDPAEPPVPWLS